MTTNTLELANKMLTEEHKKAGLSWVETDDTHQLWLFRQRPFFGAHIQERIAMFDARSVTFETLKAALHQALCEATKGITVERVVG